MPMLPEVKAAWIADLTSGEFKQITGALKGRTYIGPIGKEQEVSGYCCLGVLAHRVKESFPELLSMAMCTMTEDDQEIVITTASGHAMHGGLPSQLWRALGVGDNRFPELSAEISAQFIDANDTDRLPFSEIARLVKRLV